MLFSGRLKGGDDQAGSRRVKLWCPSVAKMAAMVVGSEEEKVDLGSIARAFGLDPETVRLNRHFIGRGVDLVAASITWRSLLKFFAAKGLATGLDGAAPLVVDGKLCKIGTKRAHNPLDAVSSIHQGTEPEDNGASRRQQAEDINLLANKRLKDIKSGCEESHQIKKWNGLGIKRKQLAAYAQLLKKLKINDTNSDSEGRGNIQSSQPDMVSSRQLQCSYISPNMKRTREDEMVVAAPLKKIR